MCVRMLRRDGKKIGIASNFAIMDDTDQKQIVRDILHDLDLDERQVVRRCRARRDLQSQE